MNNHGYTTEDDLYRNMVLIFGPDTISKSPEIHEPTGKKEMADLCVDLGDTLVVFQSKSMIIDISDFDEIKAGRISKRSEAAARQVNTTVNAKSRKQKATYTTNRGFSSEINWDSIKKVIGIVSLRIDDPHRLDPEQRFQIFIPPQSDALKEIHYFLHYDIADMSTFCESAGDFLTYLEERKRLLGKGVIVMNELDLFATFKSNYLHIEALDNGEIDTLMLAPGCWEGFLTNKEAQAQISANRSILFRFNYMLEQLHKSVGTRFSEDENYPEGHQDSYLELAKRLTRLRTAERLTFIQKMNEKCIKSTTHEAGYFVSVFPGSDLAMVGLSTDLERTIRGNYLLDLVISASNKCIEIGADVHFVIGVATESNKSTGRSFDFFGGPIDVISKMDALVSHLPKFQSAVYGSSDEFGNEINEAR